MAYTTLASLFTAIANAIRNKTLDQSKIRANDFPSKIALLTYAHGNTNISKNGQFDVKNYENAIVNVHPKMIFNGFKRTTNNIGQVWVTQGISTESSLTTKRICIFTMNTFRAVVECRDSIYEDWQVIKTVSDGSSREVTGVGAIEEFETNHRSIRIYYEGANNGGANVCVATIYASEGDL